MQVEMTVETQVEKRVKTPQAILAELAAEPTITLKQVAERIGMSTSTVERAVAVLVKDGRLRFVGPRKSGRWEVLDPDTRFNIQLVSPSIRHITKVIK